MYLEEYNELIMDARRARVHVTEKHFQTISQYMRERKAPYSPEYVTTYKLFTSRAVMFAYWDTLRALFNDLVKVEGNHITRRMGLTKEMDCIMYGYTIPAKLPFEGARLRWLMKQMHTYPLLMDQWLSACSLAVYNESSIGEHM